MYIDGAESYRPGFNPEFLKRAREKARIREMEERAKHVAEAQQMERERRERERQLAVEKIEEARRAHDVSKMERCAEILAASVLVERALIESRKARGKYKPPMSLIERRICRAFRITRDELLSHRREKRVVLARQAVAYWACRMTDLSLPDIGRRLHRDHTTILWAKNSYPAKRAKTGRFLRHVR